MPVQMEPALSQILVHVMLVFMDRYVTGVSANYSDNLQCALS